MSECPNQQWTAWSLKVRGQLVLDFLVSNNRLQLAILVRRNRSFDPVQPEESIVYHAQERLPFVRDPNDTRRGWVTGKTGEVQSIFASVPESIDCTSRCTHRFAKASSNRPPTSDSSCGGNCERTDCRKCRAGGRSAAFDSSQNRLRFSTNEFKSGG
jgi:hypothetical protein